LNKKVVPQSRMSETLPLPIHEFTNKNKSQFNTGVDSETLVFYLKMGFGLFCIFLEIAAILVLCFFLGIAMCIVFKIDLHQSTVWSPYYFLIGFVTLIVLALILLLCRCNVMFCYFNYHDGDD
jgi:hypothetical protein